MKSTKRIHFLLYFRGSPVILKFSARFFFFLNKLPPTPNLLTAAQYQDTSHTGKMTSCRNTTLVPFKCTISTPAFAPASKPVWTVVCTSFNPHLKLHTKSRKREQHSNPRTHLRAFLKSAVIFAFCLPHCSRGKKGLSHSRARCQVCSCLLTKPLMTGDSGGSAWDNLSLTVLPVTSMYKAVQPPALEFLQSITIRFLAYQSVSLHPEVPYQRRHVQGLTAEGVQHPAVLAVLWVKVTVLNS